MYITDCISANGSDAIPNESPVYVIKPAEVFFIAITPRSTQTQSDNTFQGPMYVHL